MRTYDLTQIQSYFDEWNSPKELTGMLRRIALNYTISAMQSGTICNSDLKDDLEDLNLFLHHLDKVEILTLHPEA